MTTERPTLTLKGRKPVVTRADRPPIGVKLPPANPRIDVPSLDEALTLCRALHDQREDLKALRDNADDPAHLLWIADKLRANKALLKRAWGVRKLWERKANKAWAALKATLDGE